MVRVKLNATLQTLSTGIAGRTRFFRQKLGNNTAIYELTNKEWEEAKKQVDSRNGEPFFVEVTNITDGVILNS
jgi:hypothetical protein